MKIAYHTPTLELYKKQVQKWLDEGKEWWGGTKKIAWLAEESFWYTYKENTCVSIQNGAIEYSSKKYYLDLEYKFMPVEKTLETLEIGDYVVNKDGYKRRVLTAQGEGEYRAYGFSKPFREFCGEEEKISWSRMTAYELKKNGYKVYEPETEVPEYTMEEAIAKVGHAFKIKK